MHDSLTLLHCGFGGVWAFMEGALYQHHHMIVIFLSKQVFKKYVFLKYYKSWVVFASLNCNIFVKPLQAFQEK